MPAGKPSCLLFRYPRAPIALFLAIAFFGPARAADDPPGSGSDPSTPCDGTANKSQMRGIKTPKSSSRSSRSWKGSLSSSGQSTFEFRAADEVTVRRMEPPVFFDNKGKPRKATPSELKELRGSNLKLPGYSAAFGDLDTGQMVKATLARKKESKPQAGAAPDGSGSKTENTGTAKSHTKYEVTGEIIGTIASLGSSSRTIALVVDAGVAPRGHRSGKKGKKIVDDVWITQILILPKEIQAKHP